ncbi:unnamed protein product [Vitrella brassicaformis CCMP3155]|uniref:Uncharacterized protein n=3 Tax=Vitrella brassicaformis TaxID=1169539 RepID=A0A0G4FD38_VITBC|nr:unnamed protein product [Vitrella brassicaformis CCMP3155]|eukprot:CEM10819.1 unnamed protein product [Vitrella brassicaformis CCMP3155]
MEGRRARRRKGGGPAGTSFKRSGSTEHHQAAPACRLTVGTLPLSIQPPAPFESSSPGPSAPSSASSSASPYRLPPPRSSRIVPSRGGPDTSMARGPQQTDEGDTSRGLVGRGAEEHHGGAGAGSAASDHFLPEPNPPSPAIPKSCEPEAHVHPKHTTRENDAPAPLAWSPLPPSLPPCPRTAEEKGTTFAPQSPQDDDLQQQNEILRYALGRAEEQLTRMQREKRVIVRRLEDLRSCLNEQSVILHVTERSRATLEASLAVLRQQVKDLKARHAAMRKEAAQTTAAYEQALKLVCEKESQLKDEMERNAALADTNRAAEQQVKTLSASLKEKNDHVRALEEEGDKKDQTITEMTSRLEAALLEVGALKSELREAQEDIDTHEEATSQKQQELDALTASLEHERADKTRQATALQEQLREARDLAEQRQRIIVEVTSAAAGEDALLVDGMREELEHRRQEDRNLQELCATLAQRHGLLPSSCSDPQAVLTSLSERLMRTSPDQPAQPPPPTAPPQAAAAEGEGDHSACQPSCVAELLQEKVKRLTQTLRKERGAEAVEERGRGAEVCGEDGLTGGEAHPGLRLKWGDA